MRSGSTPRCWRLVSWIRPLRTLIASTFLATLVACGTQSGPPRDTSGGTTALRIAFEAPMTSFDPFKCLNTECRQTQYLTYGYLGDFGESGTGGLAETITSSPDHTTWTVKLRPGLRFSDGNALTATDVAASFGRFLQPGVQGTIAPMRNLNTVTAPRPDTVVFTLSAPTPQFDVNLDTSYAAVFPASGLADKNFFAKPPVSAGPFMYTSADLATGVRTLKANPHYWGSQPRVQAIEMVTIADGATRYAQLRAGQIDWAKSLPAALLTDVPPALRISPAEFPGGMILLSLNDDPASNSVTTDIRVRRAIDLAVDRTQIAKVALRSHMEPLYGLPWEDIATREPSRPRDVAQAKGLLAGTPCEHGCNLKLINLTDFNWQQPLVSQIVQQNLKEIGLDVELINTTMATVKTTASASWDGMVLDNAADVPSAGSIAGYYLSTWWWYGPSPRFPNLANLANQLAVTPINEISSIEKTVNLAFDAELPYIPLANLTFLDATTQPKSVIENVRGWRLIVH